jgi:hypothetical protein
MKNRKLGATGIATILLLSLPGVLAFAGDGPHKRPLTPELAAKREMIRKQREQRITPENRKAAAEALKAERLKVYRAKQGIETPAPVTIEK